MKSKSYKEFGSGSVVHIYNRGNNKGIIFFDEQDYKAFLFRVALALGFKNEELRKDPLLNIPYSRIRIEFEKKDSFKIHTFCLMPNHFHLIAEQCGDISLSKFISQVCISYAMYINKKYKRVGHLFQDRFRSNTIEDDQQLMWTSAYIHMNPVKDKFVNRPEQYKWSSYTDFIGERNLPILSRNLIIGLFEDEDSFKKETLNYFSKDEMMSSRVLDIE